MSHIEFTFEADTSKYERSAREAKLYSDKFSFTVKSSWLQVAAALYVVNKGWDMLKGAALAQQEEQSFRNIAASYRANADRIITELRKSSADTVDTVSLIRKAGTAMMMGISPEHLTGLMEIARATSRQTGQDVSKSFDDITLAVSRQSKQILDNLGIIVQVEAANERYARLLGKSAERLTEAERKVAFLNETMRAGQELMGRLGEQGKTQAEQIQSLEAFARGVAHGIGKALLEALRYLVWGFTQAGAIVNRLFEQVAGGWGHIFELLGGLPGGEALGSAALARMLQGAEAHFRAAREMGERFGERVWNLQTQAGPGMGRAPGPGEGGDDNGVRLRELAELDKEIARTRLQEIMRMGRDEYAAWFMNVSEGDAALRKHQEQIDRAYLQQKMADHMEYGRQEAAMYDASGAFYRQSMAENYRLQKYKESLQRQQITDMIDNFLFVFEYLGQESPAFFAIYKALAIQKTAVDTVIAAAEAYDAMDDIPYFGTVLAIIAAAAALAAGAMAIAKIASSEPGGAVPAPGLGTYQADPTTGLANWWAAENREEMGSVTLIVRGDFVGSESDLERFRHRLEEAVDQAGAEYRMAA